MRFARLSSRLACLILAISIAGCSHFCFWWCDDDGGGGGGTTPTPCAAPSLGEGSLVINDPALLAADFGFAKVIDQIIATSPRPATQPAKLVQSMLDSFNATSFVHPHLNKPIPVDQRPGEAGLSATDLLDANSDDGMVPVGLFNRFDLAPHDGSNCGEYRIVYAKKQSGTPGRFFLIFEARLPNPDLSAGLAGCKPITDLWTDLNAEPSDAARVAKLVPFYFAGDPAKNVLPVVQAAHYGLPDGQARSNLFMNGPWQLREHRIFFDANDPASNLIFKPDTDKDTPLVEWFGPSANLPGGITSQEQDDFRQHFLGQPVCNLLLPDRLNPGASTSDVVNGMGGRFDPRGDEFQSSAQDNSDNPADVAEQSMRDLVTTRLTGLSGTGVNERQLLNRAGAMTCGGCHQFSTDPPNNDLGNGHVWPPSAFFVHITEDGTLSPALTSTFIPRRKSFLSEFKCNTAPVAPPAPPCPGGETAALPAVAAEAAPAEVTGVDRTVAERVRRGRNEPRLQRVDAALLRFLAVSRSGADPAALEAVEDEGTVSDALEALDAAVERAREEERALPGAFVPVRRTH